MGDIFNEEDRIINLAILALEIYRFEFLTIMERGNHEVERVF